MVELTGSYEYLCSYLRWDVDDLALTSMKEKTEEKLKELDNKITDAEENLGETDVRDACLEKAQYLLEIGDRKRATAAFKVAESKTPSVGNKIDLVFSQIRSISVNVELQFTYISDVVDCPSFIKTGMRSKRIWIEQ